MKSEYNRLGFFKLGLMFFLLVFVLTACSSVLEQEDPNGDPIVIIFRREYARYTDTECYDILIDNCEIAYLCKNGIFAVKLKPGKHIFGVEKRKRGSIYNLKPGKIYHLSLTNRSWHKCSYRELDSGGRAPAMIKNYPCVKVEDYKYFRTIPLTRHKAAEQIIPLVSLKKIKEIEKLKLEPNKYQKFITNIVLNGKDDEVRAAVIEELKEQKLIAWIALKDKNTEVRAAAIGELKDQKLIAWIALEDKNEKAREAAVGALKDQKLIASIALKDKSNMVRAAAIVQLGFLDPYKWKKLFIYVAQKDKDEIVRSAATLILSKL